MFRFSFHHFSPSSKGTNEWFLRQANDKYVKQAVKDGFIARSAYKLSQIDDKFKIFNKRKRMVVIDLGAAPGGWSQVVRRRCTDDTMLFGVDRSPLATALVGYRFIQGDFADPLILKKLNDALQAQHVSGDVDVILSDMCPDRSGTTGDYFTLADLNAKVLSFANRELCPGGHLVMKMIGGTSFYDTVITRARKHFGEVRISKPDASRAKSDETFLVALSKLAVPRDSELIVNGVGSKRMDSSVGGERGKNLGAKRGHERFLNHGLDDWPGLTKFKMRGR